MLLRFEDAGKPAESLERLGSSRILPSWPSPIHIRRPCGAAAPTIRTARR